MNSAVLVLVELSEPFLLTNVPFKTQLFDWTSNIFFSTLWLKHEFHDDVPFSCSHLAFTSLISLSLFLARFLFQVQLKFVFAYWK